MSSINERISEVVTQSGLSKTAFGEKLKVSQQYVSKLVRDGVPSDRTVADICRLFHVSETWLRTGEGDMLVEMTADEEIASLVGDILADAGDTFKKRFVSALAKLDDRGWDVLENLVNDIEDKKKKD